MFDLAFIICVDLEAGRRCRESVITDLDGRGVCEMAGKVITGNALARIQQLGLTGKVGWTCEPQGQPA